jgi:hypothetical protein
MTGFDGDAAARDFPTHAAKNAQGLGACGGFSGPEAQGDGAFAWLKRVLSEAIYFCWTVAETWTMLRLIRTFKSKFSAAGRAISGDSMGDSR